MCVYIYIYIYIYMQESVPYLTNNYYGFNIIQWCWFCFCRTKRISNQWKIIWKGLWKNCGGNCSRFYTTTMRPPKTDSSQLSLCKSKMNKVLKRLTGIKSTFRSCRSATKFFIIIIIFIFIFFLHVLICIFVRSTVSV